MWGGTFAKAGEGAQYPIKCHVIIKSVHKKPNLFQPRKPLVF